MTNLIMSKTSRAGALRRSAPTIVLLPILSALVLVPLVFIVVSSFKPTGLIFDPGFTTEHYRILLGDSETAVLFARTALFAVGGTLGALVIGGSMAWLVERTDLPYRSVFRAAIIIPMATPPVLLAISWTTVFDPKIGAFNNFFRHVTGADGTAFNIYSFHGMVLVEIFALVPSAFLLLAPAFKNMDPNLEDAVVMSGGNTRTAIRRVVLPVLAPSFLGVGAFLLLASFVVFDIPGVLGIPSGNEVVSTKIVNYALKAPLGLPDYGRVSALAVVLLAILMVVNIAYRRMLKRSERFVTVSGKGFRAKRYELGRMRKPAGFVVGAYFVLTTVVPVVMLFLMSLLPYWTGLSWEKRTMMSFSNYRSVLGNDDFTSAGLHTVVIAVVAATAVVALSTAVSWATTWGRAPASAVLDTLTFVPLALAGVMMGMALIYVFLSFNSLSLYGTIWAIAIAHLTVYLSFGTKLTTGVMVQFSRDLEDAAAVCGASTLYRIRKILLPLMRPALTGLWIWVAAHSVRELSSALLLKVRSNEVLSTLLWSYWDTGLPTSAAVVGVIMLIALTLLISVFHLVSRRGALPYNDGV